ncbi:MAG: VCBS repeat-containing protein, partial [Phycisphaerales bacterium]|nr:VCBS repeat-containing protein [Phycisphaerales bacterium]
MRWFLCGLMASTCSGQVTFSSQEDTAGLLMMFNTNGSLAVEHMTGGAAAADFDRDGDQDLFCVGGVGTADCLYINNGDGTFT